MIDNFANKKIDYHIKSSNSDFLIHEMKKLLSAYDDREWIEVYDKFCSWACEFQDEHDRSDKTEIVLFQNDIFNVIRTKGSYIQEVQASLNQVLSILSVFDFCAKTVDSILA